MSELSPVVTIDGPGGSGKGTVSRRVAQALGFHLLDSGAIYRVAALACGREGISVDDAARAAEVASTMQVSFEVLGDRTGVALNGADVSDEVPLESTGSLASKVARHPEVRDAVLGLQRRFRRPPGLVADGRDMGTVVFAEAPCKVYLTASVDERARRRYQQLTQAGLRVTLDDLADSIRERDARDMNRAVAPLKPAEDALNLDSTTLTIDEVVDRVLAHVNQRVPR